jgi:hypothetical protein
LLNVNVLAWFKFDGVLAISVPQTILEEAFVSCTLGVSLPTLSELCSPFEITFVPVGFTFFEISFLSVLLKPRAAAFFFLHLNEITTFEDSFEIVVITEFLLALAIVNFPSFELSLKRGASS